MFDANVPCFVFRRIGARSARLALLCGLLIAEALIFSHHAPAQQQTLLDSAPPPLLVASKEELARILAPEDNRDKAELSLEALSAHLSKAEAASSAGDLELAYKELGQFCAIMHRTLSALLVYDARGRQDLRALKKYDIGLRKFLLRLENLRAEMPARYEDFAVKTIHYLQDTRDAALKPMFADNVVAVPNSDK
ncbi:MAG: hypothetical protein UZ17_ACD001001235 [Acidobacteria bacterium OLB17]|nr:MAG: hypothetical protein UZ17_ACD001001235 [Acidobacteria bacterium OLB17]MCZ2391825.1 hypothetical protein [Acidobacteriota bacterium]